MSAAATPNAPEAMLVVVLERVLHARRVAWTARRASTYDAAKEDAFSYESAVFARLCEAHAIPANIAPSSIGPASDFESAVSPEADQKYMQALVRCFATRRPLLSRGPMPWDRRKQQLASLPSTPRCHSQLVRPRHPVVPRRAPAALVIECPSVRSAIASTAGQHLPQQIFCSPLFYERKRCIRALLADGELLITPSPRSATAAPAARLFFAAPHEFPPQPRTAEDAAKS